MSSSRYHSGYLADDEAGHSAYVTRVQPPKQPLFSEMRPAPKLSRVPHPPSTYAGHRRNRRGLQPFRSFLDFLTEGQVLDSLQTVVEKATERMATVKTDAGVPLLEVQDPVEVLRGGRRARARPSQGTMHRHRVRPNLCTGHPNNYPSCSSSTSGSHSSRTAGFLGAPCWDSDLAARGAGSLPSMGDRLLLEKNLKRLQRLENKGKGRNRSWSQGDSLPWDSQGSQTSSQWTQEKPLSWFSGLLGSSSSTPEASELGPAERELTLLRGEFYKKIKSLLSQPASLNLPGYCSLHQPHQTLDFLAQHDLFPALQRVVSQAVDKLSSARRFNGCPLFPTSGTSASQLPLPCEPPLPGSKSDTPTDREEPCDSSPTTGSSPLTSHRKSKSKTVSPTMSNPQVASRLRLKVTTMEEPNVPSHSQHPRQEVPDSDLKLQKPMVPSSSRQKARPCRGLHLILPSPGIVVEMASSQGCLRGPVTPPRLASSCWAPFSHQHLLFPPHLSLVRTFPPSLASLGPEVTYSGMRSRISEANLQRKSSCTNHA